jgi:hypothetical protein
MKRACQRSSGVGYFLRIDSNSMAKSIEFDFATIVGFRVNWLSNMTRLYGLKAMHINHGYPNNRMLINRKDFFNMGIWECCCKIIFNVVAFK